MAIAHVCLNCGQDLARIRPVREPHYRLRVVFCPRCATVCVRRRHPLWAGRRGARRLYHSLRMLWAKVILTVLLGLMTLGVVSMAANELRIVDSAYDESMRLVYTSLLGLALVTGVYLTEGFSHLKRPAAWAGWTALILGLLLIVAIVQAIEWMEGDRFLEPMKYALKEQFVPRAGVFLAVMALALAGIPLGNMLARLFSAGRRSAWRKALRRHRLARST